MARKTNVAINGSSYYRVSATTGVRPDGTRQRKYFYGSSKKEAEDKRDEFLAGIKKGLVAEYDKLTLGELMKTWLLDVVKPSKEANTLARYMVVYNNYVKPTELNMMRLKDIKYMYLQQYYNNLAKQGTSSSRIRNLNKVLRTFFNFCVVNDYIEKNPTFKIVIPKDEKKSKGNEKEPLDVFSDDEISRILSNCNGYMCCLVNLALATGMRQGELLGLTYGCVNLKKKEIKIKQALKRVTVFEDENTQHTEMVIGSTKTKQVRIVPVPDALIPILKKQINNQKELFLKYGMEYTKEDLLFTTESCSPVGSRIVQRSWERILKRADVRYRKFHNLRHTYASKLLEKGVDLKVISSLLGHSNIAVTADTYVHTMPASKSDAIEKLNYLFDAM